MTFSFSKATFYSFALVFVTSVTVDQFFKYWATSRHIVQFNSGISLSWLPGLNQMMVAVILIFFLLAIAWSWRKVWSRYPGWSGLFFGGAFSNIVDRFLYAGVRDWMIVPGLQLKNNMADWFVCIGLGLIIIQILQQKSELEAQNGN